MKNNNSKSIAPHTLKIIHDIFIQNGKKDIPDIKEVCSKAKINRNLALKYLYEWWDQYSKSKKNGLSDFHSVVQNLKSAQLQNVIIHLQCLAKELEAYSESLNHLPNHAAHPLGNFILNSLHEIESKLFVTYSYMDELNHDKKRIEKQLIQTLHENRRLNEEVHETQRIAKKLKQLEEQLDAKKREILTTKHLVKSLKREKRRPTLKDWFHHYKSSWEAIHK